jgi:oligopeptide/dipeptide ABC transporter ATP-binding protein
VKFDGIDLMSLRPHQMQSRRRDLQIVFQDPYGSLNPRMTVRDVLREPLLVHNVSFGRQADVMVDEILDHVSLPRAYARRYPHEFSGGQRQRIAIARALVLQPRLIVCDEPVSALDVSVQAQILNLLGDLKHRFGLSYLFVSHDLGVVRRMADRIAVMYLGRIVETGPAAGLFERPRHPYTQALLSAIPAPHPRHRRREPALEGDVPSPAAPPPGCHFHTRCPHAVDRCRKEVPVPVFVGEGHTVACLRVNELPVRLKSSISLASAAAERVQRLHGRFRRTASNDAATTTNILFAKVEEQTS